MSASVAGTGAVAVPREKARTAFQRWLGGLWFAPGGLKDYARNDARLIGMYVPYWTYDAETTTRYQGERGDDYPVQEIYRAIENGQEVERVRTVIKTRWTPAAGVSRLAGHQRQAWFRASSTMCWCWPAGRCRKR